MHVHDRELLILVSRQIERERYRRGVAGLCKEISMVNIKTACSKSMNGKLKNLIILQTVWFHASLYENMND